VKQGPLYTAGGNAKLVQLLWKAVQRFLKKLELELPYDTVIPLLGIYPKECKTEYSKDTCTPMFIAALFTIAKLWKQPRCPTTDEWMRNCGLYTQWSIIQAQRIMICGWKVNGCNWRTSC
jgi:hypothetical protein